MQKPIVKRRKTIGFLVIAVLLIAVIGGGYYFNSRSPGAVYSKTSAATRLSVAASAIRTREEEYFNRGRSLIGFSEEERSKGPAALGVDFKFISADGVAVIGNEQYSVVIFLEPTVDGLKLMWKCKAVPRDLEQIACERTQFGK